MPLSLAQPSATCFRAAALKPSRASRSLHRAPAAAPVVLAQAGRQAPSAGARIAAAARKAAAAAALAAFLAFSGPSSAAGLNTNTFQAGVGAKIEASDITEEPARVVVDKLKGKVLPAAEQMMGDEIKDEGSTYPASVVQELKTVRGEVEALDQEISNGGNESSVKSAASGVEQQINGLKGLLGFD